MLKVLDRWRRVLARILQPFSSFKGRAQKGLAVVLSLGFGAVAVTWAHFRGWFFAGHTHQVFVGVAVALVFSLWALYQVEKEADAARFVMLRLFDPMAELHPILHFNDNLERRDVFICGVQISLRNNGKEATRAFFPKVQLVRMVGRRLRPIPIKEFLPYHFRTHLGDFQTNTVFGMRINGTMSPPWTR